ncbi:MAG: nuclear transport factor 2 family protein [Litoreibacter sp.]|nr:nuclear transport factor 2 family protein [Litoreibacter sp.]
MIPDIEQARQIAQEHCAAWTAGDAARVAERYSASTSFGMNGAEPMTTRDEIAAMAAGFMSDFPDLVLTCDRVLVADHHMVYAWTFVGRHKETGTPVRFSGWEEWDLDEDLNVVKSLGWYDADDYERQVSG